MIFFRLFYNFLIIGIFSIGGGYAAIPLIRDVARNLIGLSDEMISNFIAISESTPGPLLVNLATFIGNEQAGILGAIIATLAAILPAFAIILIFAIYFTKFLKLKKVEQVLSFIRPCVMGLIMSAGLFMFYENMDIKTNINFIKAIIIAVVIIATIIIYKKITNKKLKTIPIIIIGAILGIVINMIM